MEKRTLIAVILSMGLFIIYYTLSPPPEKKPPQPTVQKTISSAVPKPQAAAIQTTTKKAPTLAAAEKEILVETDLYTAVFTNQGGALKRLVLKKYRETATPNGKPVALVSQTEMVGYTLQTESPAISLNSGDVYSTDANKINVKGNDKKQIEFIRTNANGIVVKKVYTFTGDGYEIGLENKIENGTNSNVRGTLSLMLPYPAEQKTEPSRFETDGSVTLEDGKLDTETTKKLLDNPKKFDKKIAWTGYADKYFLNAVLSESNSIDTVQIKKLNSKYVHTIISSPSFDLIPGKSYSVNYRLFFGPKDLDILKAQGAGLEQALDLGWFSAIAKPLLYTLKYFYKYTHNYGIAIIIITIIIKILFFPLTHKSYKSMKDMQKLQPKMTELREKYKNDREALNRETMELYRTHKVNPLGGCLPMVVQIPVFFALYKALMCSIELRHAPFMLWIKDLSGPDALFSNLLGLPFTLGPLPIVMGASMFIQQKMTPSNMDPMQAKIMLALPIVFTFMFLKFPSGLVLYWLINNILTIAQQAYINRLQTEA
jgi:YidC/Oxa1 family membrane protein insertase